ncbi:MAG: methyltransferase [Vulcanimicrobiota bacterium]
MIDPVGKRAIEVALEFGVIDALRESSGRVDGLAQRCGVSVRGLKPLLALLASLGLLWENHGEFSWSEEGEQFWREWSQTRLQIPDAPDWQGLDQAVRTGAPARPPIEGEEDGGDFFSGVVSTLFDLHLPVARSFAAQLPPLRRVLDLGAGSGVWSLAVARERPEVRVTAVDRRRVLEETTRPFLKKHGVLEQYELRAGSYHTVELEEGGYDLVYLGHVIHSEGWEASRSLLARARAALRPGGLLAVAEWIASEPRSADYHACLFDLNMLMFTRHGLVFTAREMERLVLEAGFQDPAWVGSGKYPVLRAEAPSRR